jgi:pimeloyl-ACP methyl ester carboxylesterase
VTPVVFLHGWGGSSRTAWGATRLPQRLAAAGRETVVVDLPGHGDSAGSHDSADYDQIVGLVDASLPEGPLDLVGYSLGAKISLMIAARRPERVNRLVLAGVGENVFAPEPGGEAVRTAMTEGFAPDLDPVARASAVYALQAGGDPAAIGAVLCRSWEPPTPDMLTALEGMPILLVNGAEDGVIRSPEGLAACLPHAEVHVLAGVDHFSTPYSAELHELVEAFL